MTTTPMKDDVDRLARFLCDLDQENVPPERRETVEQTGYDWHGNARRILDFLADESAALRQRIEAVMADHECDEACELFNCDDTSSYLVSRDRLHAALAATGLREDSGVRGPITAEVRSNEGPAPAGLAQARVVFWVCPDGHSAERSGQGVETVQWVDGIAHCTEQGCVQSSAGPAPTEDLRCADPSCPPHGPKHTHGPWCVHVPGGKPLLTTEGER